MGLIWVDRGNIERCHIHVSRYGGIGDTMTIMWHHSNGRCHVVLPLCWEQSIKNCLQQCSKRSRPTAHHSAPKTSLLRGYTTTTVRLQHDYSTTIHQLHDARLPIRNNVMAYAVWCICGMVVSMQ